MTPKNEASQSIISTYFHAVPKASPLSCLEDVNSSDAPLDGGNEWKSPVSRKAWGAPFNAKTTRANRVVGQLFLDLGQKDFSYKTCSSCGLLYAAGVEEDEKVHAVFHRSSTEGIAFQGWQHERIVKSIDSRGSRIVLVLPDDPHNHSKKVKEVAGVMECELGLSKDWLLNKRCKTYLFISQGKKVVGCLVAEPIEKAFAMLRQGKDYFATTAKSGVSTAGCGVQIQPCHQRESSSGSLHNAEAPEASVPPKDVSSPVSGDDAEERCTPLAECSSTSPCPRADCSEGLAHKSVGEAMASSSGRSLSGCLEQGPALHQYAGERVGRERRDPLGEDHQSATKVRRPKDLFFGSIKFVREVSKRRVVGRSQQIDKNASSMIMSSADPIPASCGVRAVWVHRSERKKGIATHLLDAVRCTFAYGHILSPTECAFSQPTEDGRAFAARYFGTESFLVYR